MSETHNSNMTEFQPQGWFETWLYALFQPFPKTYKNISQNTSIKINRAITWIFFSNIIGLSIIVLVTLYNQLATQNIEDQIITILFSVTGIKILPLIILVSCLFTIIIVYNASIILFTSKIFGGKIRFTSLFYTIASYTSPLILLNSIIVIIPKLIYLSIGIVIIYLFIAIISVKGVYGFTWAKAILVNILSIFISIIIVTILILGIQVGSTYSKNTKLIQQTKEAQQFASKCETTNRLDEVPGLIQSGAIIIYEKIGGSNCEIDELFIFYADGRIIYDNSGNIIENNISKEEISDLQKYIDSLGWFTGEIYNSWHTPCGSCHIIYVTIVKEDEYKTVKAVEGGTDAPGSFWSVTGEIEKIILGSKSEN